MSSVNLSLHQGRMLNYCCCCCCCTPNLFLTFCIFHRAFYSPYGISDDNLIFVSHPIAPTTLVDSLKMRCWDNTVLCHLGGSEAVIVFASMAMVPLICRLDPLESGGIHCTFILPVYWKQSLGLLLSTASRKLTNGTMSASDEWISCFCISLPRQNLAKSVVQLGKKIKAFILVKCSDWPFQIYCTHLTAHSACYLDKNISNRFPSPTFPSSSFLKAVFPSLHLIKVSSSLKPLPLTPLQCRYTAVFPTGHTRFCCNVLLVSCRGDYTTRRSTSLHQDVRQPPITPPGPWVHLRTVAQPRRPPTLASLSQ